MGIQLKLEPFLSEEICQSRPVVIAGPCSAETEEQVMLTAQQLKRNGVQIFRAGIWKPRTRPNHFEGVGKDGLLWLKRVKEELGMLTATEVANAKHVFECLKYGVDILWVGARTSANPFAVQEIADALSGVDIPVMVKNPVNPDAELWIGALERLNDAGITKLAAIHRGFSNYNENIYRNNPQWQIPIELKRKIPEIPMFVDPSHISGSRERIFEICQRAMDLNFEGLIVEAHNNPDHALSDAKQQVTPDRLQVILDSLILRDANITDANLLNIEELRKEIDTYDKDVLDIFEKRMQVADKIGLYKKTHNITILQQNRWDEILNKRTLQAQEKGLSEDFIIRIFRAIHQESINRQMKIMNEGIEKDKKHRKE